MEKFAWSEWQVGLSLGYAGVFMIIVQAFLIRWAIPNLGAYKAGLIGLLTMTIGFSGYALSTESWQLYVWLALAALSGFVSPAFQSIMTSQVPANAQGELQGALSSLNSVTSIIGPLLMTKLFSTYTGVDASYYLPGAPFLAAALLTLASLILFVPLVRHFGLTTLGRRAAPAPS
jgi:DHA1 family tetracycline resistance protein-like MFS transporter